MILLYQTQVATLYFLYESCTAHLLRFVRHQGVNTLASSRILDLVSSLFRREKEGNNLSLYQPNRLDGPFLWRARSLIKEEIHG